MEFDPLAWDDHTKFLDENMKDWRTMDWFKEGNKSYFMAMPPLLATHIFWMKYPKWFKRELLMLGPTSIVLSPSWGKCAAVARTHELRARSVIAFEPPTTGLPTLEDIQDSIACGAIVSKPLKTLVEQATDEMNALWERQIENGYEIYPYFPLLMVRRDTHLLFYSRFASLASKERSTS